MPVERKLVVRDGDRVREVLLVGTVTVGRSPTCEISAADPRLSRTHATFNVVGADVIVRDLDSSNGTLVNGERITEHHLVAADTVEIGPFILRLAEPAHAAAPIAKPAAGDDEATVMMARRASREPAAREGAPTAPTAHSASAQVAAPRHAPSASADESTDATRLQRPQRAAGSPSRPSHPTPVDPGPSAAVHADRAVHRADPIVAIRRAPAGELSFPRAMLLGVIPLALVSFLAGLVPDLMQPDQRGPLLRAYYGALAAGAADLVRASGEAARPIDTVTATLRGHTGVVSALIVGPDGRVVAPLNEAGTRVDLPPITGSAPRFIDAATGHVDVHVPAVTADGRAVIVVMAVDPAAIHPAPAGSLVGTLLLIACLGAAWLVARRVTAVADSRLSQLGEEIELMTTGQVSSGRDPFGLRGGERILDAVNFALSPAGRRQVEGPAQAPRVADNFGFAADRSSMASIEADATFRIVQADAGCEALLGLVPGAVRGVHLIDALRDQAVADEVLRLVAMATPDQAAQGEVSLGDRGLRLGIDVKWRSGPAPLTIHFTRL